MLLAAALGGVLGVVVIVGRMLESDDTVAAPYPGPSMAEELRERAFAACDAQRWDECLQGLDAARDRDPSGEQDARVREYRQRAESALKGGPPAPPR
jgi:hypothetical protein